jgi:2-polyprenyl-3-methyl-5-hydroxy-6-metoxy-1,4-benzoquinol methylase
MGVRLLSEVLECLEAGHRGAGIGGGLPSIWAPASWLDNRFDWVRRGGTIGGVLLTITTTRAPATDLGYLLHKHPERVQSFGMSAGGTAHVFYPEASAERCTAALLLEVDPVGLVRGGGEGITHYVNDRPYAASSLLAVALKEVFRTALTGRCDALPEMAATPIPLEVWVPALRCSGGAELAGRVFGPLGWEVSARTVPLEPVAWGASAYLDVRLAGTVRLADALNHLYVLLPVLDDAKHYWVSTDEVDKLVRAGSGWLAGHPEKGLITRRYLAHQRVLTAAALARLAEADDLDPEELDNAVPQAMAPDETAEAGGAETAETETGTAKAETEEAETGAADAETAEPLVVLRRRAVLDVLREAGARSVADLGCGEGALTAALLKDATLSRVVATDVSARALQHAARRLRLDRMPEARRARLELFQTSLTYRDRRLAGLDAAVLMEVIEHVDPERLAALERAVFGFAAPRTVVVTTPNREHNAVYGMPEGALRHRDHRFEWTREQFSDWAERVAAAYGYRVRYLPVGPVSPQAGPPTQMAVFSGGVR